VSIAFGFAFDRAFERVAFVGSSATAYPEGCLVGFPLTAVP
jgi:hypothetical protein